jgi:hypothetical protein
MPRCSAKCQFRTNAPQQTVSLFDDFAGASEQRRRHGEADRFRSLHVDYIGHVRALDAPIMELAINIETIRY